MIRFVIPGQAVAKQRPRLGKHGTYTPDKTVNFENLVKVMAYEAMKSFGAPLMHAPIKIDITVCFAIPNKTSKKNTEGMLRDGILPAKRPDLDNIVKSITDACNGVVYKDDSQICEIVAKKVYREKAETIIIVKDI